MTLPRDDRGMDSDDPIWRDTWWFNATDVERNRAIWVHSIWSEREQRGRHCFGIHEAHHAEKRVALSSGTPFASDLLTLEVDPYRSLRLRVPEFDIDVTWTAWQEPIDFSQPPFAHRVMDSAHFQASGRAEGVVRGEPFMGNGHRDRTSGPRQLTNAGRVLGFTLVGVDQEVSFLSHVVQPSTATFDAPPSGVSGGYTCIDGVITPQTAGNSACLRYPDGLPGALRIGDDEFVVQKMLGSVRWTWDRDLTTPNVAQERVVFTTLSSFIIAESARHGRVAGGYNEGLLMTY